jgi:CRISPR-associated endonuclease/helicase Cas3
LRHEFRNGGEAITQQIQGCPENHSYKKGMEANTTYEKFFLQATNYLPYPYQIKLATSSSLPKILDIPTGLGKTAAVTLAWLWRRFVGEQVKNRAPKDVRSETPRRLVYCLPMRVLVEQTAASCRQWVDRLVEVNTFQVDTKPAVHVLMGGEIAGDWDFWPEQESILIGTQDQLLSRALNRGYAMSRFRWPVHFGLLNNDCLWVIDEVQLMGPGLSTSIQLQGLRESLGTHVTTQSVWMSATVSQNSFSTIDSPFAREKWHDVCLGISEDTDNLQIKSRLHAKKSLQKAGIILSAGTQKGYAQALAAEIDTLRRSASGVTIVILNRVSRAQEVTKALARLFADKGDGIPLMLVHSRFRPHERRRIEGILKNLAAGKTEKRILVATQAIEAGVDVSASTLLTELAPWSSLVQRFGRLNRYGELETGRAYWIDIVWKKDQKGKTIIDPGLALPYGGEELDLAREQLQKLHDVSPANLKAVSISSIAQPHAILRKKDVLELFDTTPDLAGSDIDVSLYIRDANDMDVSVFWREWEGERPPDDLPAPSPEELCPVSVNGMRDFLQDCSSWVWDPLDKSWRRADRNRLRPGMVMLLHSEQGGYDPDLGWLGKEAKAPVPLVPSLAQLPSEASGDDPFTAANTFITIADHSSEVVKKVQSIVDALGCDKLPTHVLLTAARWHDRGKAHAVFQSAVKNSAAIPPEGTEHKQLWAKCPSLGKYARPYFRHELASAIAVLLNNEPDLAAYLVAAHHGKARLSIRSIPNEATPPQAQRFARGIWEGDVLPETDLGGGVIAPEVELTLVFMELGQSEQYGASWLKRYLSLVEQNGPFRLAYLESLLRIADWRASSETRQAENE